MNRLNQKPIVSALTAGDYVTAIVNGKVVRLEAAALLNQYGGPSGTLAPADADPEPAVPSWYFGTGPGNYTNLGINTTADIVFLVWDGSAWSAVEHTVDTAAIEANVEAAVSAKAEADAIQLLRLHDPNLVFSGFVNTTTATPAHTANKAYIATASGTIFGVYAVNKGDIIIDDGTIFYKKNTFPNLNFSNARNVVSNFNFDKYSENYYIIGISGTSSFVNDNNIIGTVVNKWVASADLSQYFIRVKTDNDLAAGEEYKARLILKISNGANVKIKIQILDKTGVFIANAFDGILLVSNSDYFLSPEYNITIPTGGYYIRFIIYEIADSVEVSTAGIYIYEAFENVKEYLPFNQRSVIQNYYVNQLSGSDSYKGNNNYPFATINRAISEIAKVKGVGYVPKDEMNTKIIIAEGDYRESLNINQLRSLNIELFAKPNEVVRILGSDKIEGFSKTTGYTNVYEAEFSGTLQTYNNVLTELDSGRYVIFEDGRKDKQIITSEKHGLQNGREYRLPYSVLVNQLYNTDLATTLSNLDANPGYFYYDSENHKLYVHASDSDNPSANGYSYEYAVRNGITASTDYSINVKMSNLIFMFSVSNGVDFTGVLKAETCNIKIYGSRLTGYTHEGSNVYSNNDEVGGAFIDGVGSASAATIESFGNYNYLWVHDCRDNAVSFHELGNLVIDNSLFEYCGDGGLYPAFGAYCICSNTLSRKNNQWPTSSGYGFAIVGTASGVRINGSMTLINCVSINNKYGVGNLNNNIVICYNVISYNNSNADFTSSSSEDMNLINCKGSTKSGPGTITVTSVPYIT